MGLKEHIYGYDKVAPKDILNHIFDSYAKIDDAIAFANKRTFKEPSDMRKPIDVYFCKQEDCQVLATGGGIPVSETEMVRFYNNTWGKLG